uniref:Uncharacterized protein n=1 Tax=viral metagenome TaxID=1070528 RepID=A0A6M3LXM2_9ZZZZ
MKTNYSTKKTLFEPVSITIDEAEYALDKITPGIILEALKWQKRAEEGDIQASIQQLSILTGAPAKTLNQLDVREIKEALLETSAKITEARRKSTAAVPKEGEPDGAEAKEKN